MIQFDVTSTVYAIPYGRGKIKRVEIELYTTVNMVTSMVIIERVHVTGVVPF